LPQLRETNSDTAIKKEENAKVMSKMTGGKKRHVKRSLAQGKPTVCVGKSALAHDEAKKIASKIAEQTEASLVEVRGHTFMLYESDKK
jgi:RNA-binding protein YhbY